MLINESELPCPRLEFRWAMVGDSWANSVCDYNFVFPLTDLDIRREVYDDDGELTEDEISEFTVKIGTTTRNSSGANGPMRFGEIDTPYRDGAHAKWDAPHFGNPPIYAVCDGKAMLVTTKETTP